MVRFEQQNWYCEFCAESGVLGPGEDIDRKQCDACGEPVVPG